MQQCIGTKLISATPMTRQEYNDLRGWELPADEDGADEGYLVEYHDGGQANHPNFAGYISWSPADVFERAYRKTNGMSFGLAIEAAKKGAKIARAGWNGKGMFIVYQKGYHEGIPANKNTAEAAQEHFGRSSLVPYRDYLAMKTVDGDIVPWIASQSDILEDDWMIVGE